MNPRSRPSLVLLAAFVAAAFPVAEGRAATVSVSAAVKVVRPLELSAKQSLNFGQIVMANVTGPTNVSLSMAGVLTCGAGLTCSGSVLPAIYNVRGSNNNTINIFARASNLINASDGSRITFTPIAPASIVLTNSGAPGRDFNVGGSIAIVPATSDGLYSGAIDVTVDYN